MRLEPSLNVTPEGSLADIPTAVEREKKEQVPEEELLGTSSETTYMEIPNTRVKTVLESPKREAPRIIQRTKEASREEAIASTQQFFAAVDRRNASITTGSQLASTEVHERDVVEVPDVPTATTTPPVNLDVEPRGTSSPRISLPEGSPSHPLLLLHVDQELGCSNLLRDRSLNLEEKMPVLVKATHPQWKHYLRIFLMS